MNVAPQPVSQRRVIAVLGTVFLWAFVALPYLLGSYRCPVATLTHHPCPGCGMTRAFMLLFAGDIGASLRMHPLAVPTAGVQAAIAIGSLVEAMRSGAPWMMFTRRWGRALVVALLLVFAADFVLWLCRAAGAFGGPVPVS